MFLKIDFSINEINFEIYRVSYIFKNIITYYYLKN